MATTFEITGTANSFNVKQLNGATIIENSEYPLKKVKVEVSDGIVKLITDKPEDTYTIPIDSITVPANNGTAQDIYSKLTQIIY